MKSSLIFASAALIGIALSSCNPIPGPSPQPDPNRQFTEEQLRQQELERQRIAQQTDLINQQNRITGPNNNFNNQNTNPVGPTDYPFASKVPGKIGFVFSPYGKQVVDVRDIPSGTLVEDPHFPGQKKYFRVP